jgi:hypothetical protein
VRAISKVVFPFLLGALASIPSVAAAQDADACINANESAVTLRKAHKLIDERAALSACAASSCPEAVRASCQQRLAQLNQAIPSIIFIVKDGEGHDLSGVKLTIDGALKGDRLDGSSISLDAGDHEFRFEVPGQAPVVRHFVLHEKEQNRSETVVIGAASAPQRASTASPSESAGGTGRTQRTIGVVVGGVGLAGLAVGGLFGAFSLSAHNGYQRYCGASANLPNGVCTQDGVNGERDAATKGTISTLAFIAGGALVLVGTALFILAPSADGSAQIAIGPDGVHVRGRF